MSSQRSVIDFLREEFHKDPNRYFKEKELEKRLKIIDLGHSLRRLRKTGEINYKREDKYPFGFLYQHNPDYDDKTGFTIKLLNWTRKKEVSADGRI